MVLRNRRVLPESPSETLAERYDFQRHHVDVLCGGFPCQDISNAGKRAGLSGERSGLWRYMVQAVRVVRPKFVLVENVAALLGRGMGTVLGDLAASGYDSEWDCLPAADFGAPHIRKRIWILAYPGRRHGDEGMGEELDREASVRLLSTAISKRCDWWKTEPRMDRVVTRLPGAVDRLKSLGNAVVPQIVEWIGKQIMNLSPAPTSSGKGENG